MEGRLASGVATRQREEILNIAKQKSFLVRWVAAHQAGDHPAHLLNNQVDLLTCLARLTIEGEEEKWEHLLEWFHVKRGHSGSKDLFKEAVSRGWSVTRKLCDTIISVCDLCCTQLEEHNPLKDQALHPGDNKGIWDAWQVDYIGPFWVSEGKCNVLVGVEIVLGLTQAEVVSWATGESTVKGLK